MLTTGSDEFTGTDANDAFNADVLTANDGDTLDGAGGADTLNVETAANLTDKFVTSNIETVNLNALGAVSVDMKNMTGVETFNSNDAAGAVTVKNIADATMAVSVKGAATNSLTLDYTTGTLNGDADKLMATLNGSSSTSIISSDSGFESAEVKTTADSTLTALTAAGATALTLSGDAALTLADGSVDSFTDYTITNTGKVTYTTDITSVKTFSASANTAGIVGKTSTGGTGLDKTTVSDVLTMSTTGSLVQTGSGADNINVDTSSIFSTGSGIIKLGAGDDILNLSAVSTAGEYIYGEAGDDLIYVGGALTAADLIDGGEGTDTVSFKTGTHSLIAKGIEKVNVESAASATDSVSFVSVDSAVDITDSGAGATTFSNLKSGSTYTSTVVNDLSFSTSPTVTALSPVTFKVASFSLVVVSVVVSDKIFLVSTIPVAFTVKAVATLSKEIPVARVEAAPRVTVASATLVNVTSPAVPFVKSTFKVAAELVAK